MYPSVHFYLDLSTVHTNGQRKLVGSPDRAWLSVGGIVVGGIGGLESLGTCVERRGVSVCVGAARASGWASTRLATLARRLLPAACSPHGGASPPYCRGNRAPGPRHRPAQQAPARLPNSCTDYGPHHQLGSNKCLLRPNECNFFQIFPSWTDLKKKIRCRSFYVGPWSGTPPCMLLG